MTNPMKAVAGLNGTTYVEMSDAEAADFAAFQSAAATAQIRQDKLDAITKLESTITPRRLREAVLGTDAGWLANINSQIATLRSQL